MNCKLTLIALACAISIAHCAPSPKESSTQGASFDITSDDLYNVDSNNILPYNPVDPKPIRVEIRPRAPQNGNNMKSSSFTNLERESSSTIDEQRRPASVANVMAPGDDAERSGSPNVDKMKDIALNSREVRLMGPEKREVEMKDDLPTKVVVALENLQKEAKEVLGTVNEKLDKGWTDLKGSEVFSQMNEKLDKGWTDLKGSEVWGQVNEKLDKGWTDFKSMLEGVVSPSSKSG